MEKRTVLAVGLIIVVIAFYNLVIIPRFSPPPSRTAPHSGPAEPAAPQTTPTPAALAPAPSPDGTTVQVPAAQAPAIQASLEKIAVDRPLYAATFSNLGGTLESWRLKSFSYAKGQKDAAGALVGGQPVELVRTGGAPPLSFAFIDPATQAAFAVPMAVTRADDGFTLEGADAQGLRVARKHVFTSDGYTMELFLQIRNLGPVPRAVSWETSFGPGVDPHLPEKERTDEAAVTLAGNSFDTVKLKKPGQRQDLGPVSWVGVGNRYFLAALLPKEGTLSAFVRRPSDAGEEVGLRGEFASLAPGQTASWRMDVYLGPKQRGILAGAGRGLERSVDYGWFSWLAIPFLGILQFCHRVLGSWGIAILALTLLVKAALFPISFKMFRSMKKMQELQPKLQALKAKFKGDSQALQRATMELYREQKVNPMAGCLPMLVQIPVFFALYRVLYNAIELRGAGFLYIPDLSLKDPYYVTPLLMGATMLIQQRMTPTAGDPMQARMMMFMPVIFTAMFINFSSGLVLYFLFSNVLSIAEQRLFRALGARDAKGAAPAAAEPAEGKKKRLR